jgi:hypothetical protein
MAGHVFVTRGDLTALACSAWVLPGNEDHGPGTDRHWLTPRSGIADQFDRGRLRHPEPVPSKDRLWRLRRPADPRAPQCYLMNSGGHHGLSLDWYLAGLDQFLETIQQDQASLPRGLPRERPLVGVPMFGTGLGGAGQTRGGSSSGRWAGCVEIAQHDEVDADFALVTHRESDFAAAQWARKSLERDRELSYELDVDLFRRRRGLLIRRAMPASCCSSGAASAWGLDSPDGLS